MIAKDKVEEIIRKELRWREEKGQQINFDYIEKKISKEEAQAKAKALGQGVWWGGEACWGLCEVVDYKAKEVKDGIEAETVCLMEYCSSHFVYGEGEPMRKNANIKLKLDPELKVQVFDFSW